MRRQLFYNNEYRVARSLRIITIVVSVVCIVWSIVIWIAGNSGLAYSVFIWGAIAAVSTKLVRVAIEQSGGYLRSIVLGVIALIGLYLVMRIVG